MKITWESSNKIHRTMDGKVTVCGHDCTKSYDGSVRIPQRTTKKHKCKICFTEGKHYEEKFIGE